jgi:DNA-binding CsgD family transcriptional regulator
MVTISDKSRAILLYIAQGHTYQQIVDAYPDFTYLDIFSAAQEAIDIIDMNKRHDQDTVAYRIDHIRKTHPKAYEKWDTEQDNKLKELFTAGISVKEIADSLERQTGAISSRLRKLGLVT